LPTKVRRSKVLTSDIDNAINGLINPSASINGTTDDDKFMRWKRSELHAEKDSNHANNPIKY
jgi:hypothetical protein